MHSGIIYILMSMTTVGIVATLIGAGVERNKQKQKWFRPWPRRRLRKLWSDAFGGRRLPPWAWRRW